MRALLTGALAATLVACTSLPHPETGGARKPVASKVVVKTAKSIKLKTRAVAKFKHLRTTGLAPAAQPKMADPVTEQAKATIAALLEDPASAEFTKLRRAVKKLLSKSVDTICGYVKGKTASGEDTGEMPFLYIIDDGRDGAYLVDGKSHVSDAVHSVICK